MFCNPREAVPKPKLGAVFRWLYGCKPKVDLVESAKVTDIWPADVV